jgi:hypothetical protein
MGLERTSYDRICASFFLLGAKSRRLGQVDRQPEIRTG